MVNQSQVENSSAIMGEYFSKWIDLDIEYQLANLEVEIDRARCDLALPSEKAREHSDRPPVNGRPF
jgi:hypothetical protein